MAHWIKSSRPALSLAWSKQNQPYALFLVRSERWTSVDPEGAAQARTFQYIVVRINKYCTQVLGVSFAQLLCTVFGNTYNYVLEHSSEYTVGLSQSSSKKGVLNVYKSFFSSCYIHVFCWIISILHVPVPVQKIFLINITFY